MGAQTSDLWNRKQAECGGGTAAPGDGTGRGGLACAGVELPVAFQAGQTPGKVASLRRSGWRAV